MYAGSNEGENAGTGHHHPETSGNHHGGLEVQSTSDKTRPLLWHRKLHPSTSSVGDGRAPASNCRRVCTLGAEASSVLSSWTRT